MPKENERCPSCGSPTAVGTRCAHCATVTDLELKGIQEDMVKQADALEALGPLPNKNVAITVEGTGQRYPLTTRKIKIGRDPSNQVIVPDDTFASRNHAWITFEDGEFWLEDLASTNGTLLNGHPVVKRQLITSGDKIRVGHTELTFEVDEN